MGFYVLILFFITCFNYFFCVRLCFNSFFFVSDYVLILFMQVIVQFWVVIQFWSIYLVISSIGNLRRFCTVFLSMSPESLRFCVLPLRSEYLNEYVNF